MTYCYTARMTYHTMVIINLVLTGLLILVLVALLIQLSRRK